MIDIFGNLDSLYIEEDLNIIGKEFEIGIAICESSDEYDEYIDEQEDVKSTSNVLIKYLKNIIEKIKSMIRDITEAANKKFAEISARATVNRLKKDINKAAKSGLTVKYFDVEKYTMEYKHFYGDLTYQLDKAFGEGNFSNKNLSAKQAEILINKTNKIVSKYEKSLAEIHDKEIDHDPEKLLNWVEKNLDTKNSIGVETLEDYIARVERCLSSVERVEKDLKIYGEHTGYKVHAKSIKDHINNTLIYVKRNADWIGVKAVGYAVIAIAKAMKIHIISNSMGKEKLSNGNYWFSDNMREDYKKAKKDYKDSKMGNFSSALGVSGLATGAAGEVMKHKANAEGRNSIYNKK